MNEFRVLQVMGPTDGYVVLLLGQIGQEGICMVAIQTDQEFESGQKVRVRVEVVDE